MWAAQEGHAEVVKQLLTARADPSEVQILPDDAFLESIHFTRRSASRQQSEAVLAHSLAIYKLVPKAFWAQGAA
jgi:hypothetical protein